MSKVTSSNKGEIMKSVIILSGGLDSTVLATEAVASGNEVFALTFNYGQRHSCEIEAAEAVAAKLGIPHKIINIPDLGMMGGSALTDNNIDVPEDEYDVDNLKVTVVPNRNMIMLSFAVSYAISVGADRILYGAHSGDHAVYPDCRKEFINAMKLAIAKCSFEPVFLSAPYQNKTKAEIVEIGINVGAPMDLTWSCYNGGHTPCGRCSTCRERAEAFKANNITDPALLFTDDFESDDESRYDGEE